MALGFGSQPLLLGGGQGLNALPLHFGLLQYRGHQFAFAPLNFGVLHLDLRALFHLLDFHLLRDDLLLLMLV